MATTQKQQPQETETVPQPMTAAEAIVAAKTAKTAPVSPIEVDDRGFSILRDKLKLVGRKFTIIDWEDLYDPIGDYWQAKVHIVIGDKAYTFTDSSETGVRGQLIKLGVRANMSVWPKGLRYSEYANPVNPSQTSRTFYLDDSGL